MPFDDDEHIIYVNGSYNDDTPLGKLVHDFKCKTPSEMYYTPLAERAHDLKEMNGGNANMCDIMEELNAKAVKINSEQTALRLIKRKKLTLEEIAEDSNLTLEEVKAIAAEAEKMKS